MNKKFIFRVSKAINASIFIQSTFSNDIFHFHILLYFTLKYSCPGHFISNEIKISKLPAYLKCAFKIRSNSEKKIKSKNTGRKKKYEVTLEIRSKSCEMFVK
jgi:hypothetical protein